MPHEFPVFENKNSNSQMERKIDREMDRVLHWFGIKTLDLRTFSRIKYLFPIYIKKYQQTSTFFSFFSVRQAKYLAFPD